jgi:hypothetical protein
MLKITVKNYLGLTNVFFSLLFISGPFGLKPQAQLLYQVHHKFGNQLTGYKASNTKMVSMGIMKGMLWAF